MFKLLIIEDERWEREGLIRLFCWEEMGVGPVMTANDGLEGLEMIERERPDIIITDIRMPGADGLEMLERAGNALAKAHCIVLSGYGEFEYAKKAVHLGVKEFLVKPVNVTELEETIRRIVALLLEERLTGDQYRKVHLLELLSQPGGKGEEERWRDEFGIDARHDLRVAVVKKHLPDDAASLPAMQVVDMDGDLVLFLPSGQPFPDMKAEGIGISILGEDTNSIQDAYRQAKQAAEFAAFWSIRQPVRPVALAQPRGKGAFALDASWGNRFTRAIRSANDQDLAEAERALFGGLRAHPHYERAAVAGFLFSMINEIAGQAEVSGDAQTLMEIETLGQMEEYFHRLTSSMLVHVRERLGHTDEYVLKRVQTIIQERYADNNLTLRAVAAKVFLSPNYVGVLFKKLTGTSFSDYLCQYRMQKAAQMLCEPGRKINWVAAKVGIPNTSYFCILFKEAYGVSPSKYQASVHRQ